MLALRSLEDVFGRVQALWKPVATEEAFEIVRRRLFEPIKDLKARDAVCRAFADAYITEGAKLPSETQESRYYERLTQAYPIHPEVFDRLYEDWSTIDGFQRTRGVLKLMAKVIARLWKADNKDFLILPGSLPLADGDVRNEMTYLLPPGWDPVIEGDIDGDRAETTELEGKEPRFGQVNAARRVARTLFLGTAPSCVATKAGIRGLDRGRVLLGCLQPGQTTAVYADALSRLADRLHYLNSSGDKTADTTRFWFDTRANLRREMEDRKQRFDLKTDVRKKIEDVVKKLFASVPLFDGIHVFTTHADVPDDSALRLVVLSPDQWFMKEESRQVTDAVLEFLRTHGSQPRHRANRLIFLAADHSVFDAPPGRNTSGAGLGKHCGGRGRRATEYRSNSKEASREGVTSSERSPAPSSPRMLQVAALPRAGRPNGDETDRRIVPVKHDQRQRVGRTGSGLPRERTGDRYVVTDSPASEAEGILLEKRQVFGRGNGILGRHAPIPLSTKTKES